MYSQHFHLNEPLLPNLNVPCTCYEYNYPPAQDPCQLNICCPQHGTTMLGCNDISVTGNCHYKTEQYNVTTNCNGIVRQQKSCRKTGTTPTSTYNYSCDEIKCDHGSCCQRRALSRPPMRVCQANNRRITDLGPCPVYPKRTLLPRRINEETRRKFEQRKELNTKYRSKSVGNKKKATDTLSNKKKTEVKQEEKKPPKKDLEVKAEPTKPEARSKNETEIKSNLELFSVKTEPMEVKQETRQQPNNKTETHAKQAQTAPNTAEACMQTCMSRCMQTSPVISKEFSSQKQSTPACSTDALLDRQRDILGDFKKLAFEATVKANDHCREMQFEQGSANNLTHRDLSTISDHGPLIESTKRVNACEAACQATATACDGQSTTDWQDVGARAANELNVNEACAAMINKLCSSSSLTPESNGTACSANPNLTNEQCAVTLMEDEYPEFELLAVSSETTFKPSCENLTQRHEASNRPMRTLENFSPTESGCMKECVTAFLRQINKGFDEASDSCAAQVKQQQAACASFGPADTRSMRTLHPEYAVKKYAESYQASKVKASNLLSQGQRIKDMCLEGLRKLTRSMQPPMSKPDAVGAPTQNNVSIATNATAGITKLQNISNLHANSAIQRMVKSPLTQTGGQQNATSSTKAKTMNSEYSSNSSRNLRSTATENAKPNASEESSSADPMPHRGCNQCSSIRANADFQLLAPPSETSLSVTYKQRPIDVVTKSRQKSDDECSGEETAKYGVKYKNVVATASTSSSSNASEEFELNFPEKTTSTKEKMRQCREHERRLVMDEMLLNHGAHMPYGSRNLATDAQLCAQNISNCCAEEAEVSARKRRQVIGSSEHSDSTFDCQILCGAPSSSSQTTSNTYESPYGDGHIARNQTEVTQMAQMAQNFSDMQNKSENEFRYIQPDQSMLPQQMPWATKNVQKRTENEFRSAQHQQGVLPPIRRNFNDVQKRQEDKFRSIEPDQSMLPQQMPWTSNDVLHRTANEYRGIPHDQRVTHCQSDESEEESSDNELPNIQRDSWLPEMNKISYEIPKSAENQIPLLRKLPQTAQNFSKRSKPDEILAVPNNIPNFASYRTAYTPDQNKMLLKTNNQSERPKCPTNIMPAKSAQRMNSDRIDKLIIPPEENKAKFIAEYLRTKYPNCDLVNSISTATVECSQANMQYNARSSAEVRNANANMPSVKPDRCRGGSLQSQTSIRGVHDAYEAKKYEYKSITQQTPQQENLNSSHTLKGVNYTSSQEEETDASANSDSTTNLSKCAPTIRTLEFYRKPRETHHESVNADNQFKYKYMPQIDITSNISGTSKGKQNKMPLVLVPVTGYDTEDSYSF